MTKKSKQVVAKPYEPTPLEQSVLDINIAKAIEKPTAPVLKNVTENGESKIDVDHPDQQTGLALLMDAIGTTDTNFLNGLLGQIVLTSSRNGEAKMDEVNFILSAVKGNEPKDQVETMMATQMAVVHQQTMFAARLLNYAETIQERDSAERAFNKLARTFIAQMEALKRYRTGGEQKVTVKHVTVNEGGQAIVGNIKSGGEG